MRIELTRSILLGGETAEHAEKGAIYDVPRVLALDLIAQRSAIRCGLWRFIFLWATGVDVKPRRIAEAKPQADHSGRSQDETVFPIGGNVDRTEKANEVMQRAEKLGIQLTFDSGLAFAEPKILWGDVFGHTSSEWAS